VTRLRLLAIGAALFWLALIVKLMIADVWDETNGMLLFCDPSHSLGWNVHFVLTQSLGFWRPLPTLIAMAVLHVVRDFDLNWRLLRFFDSLELLGSLALLVDAVTRWSERDDVRDLAFTIAVLFSGGAIITAGWYANIFDATALLVVSAGLWLLARGRAFAAGVVLGVAFFCKETTALVFPFLLALLAAKRITFRDALRSGIPAAILGGIYFAIRSRIVPFGSSSDVHGFQPALFLPTLINLCDSFWRQTLKGNGPGIVGFVFLAISLAALRKPKLIAAAALIVLATTVLYWAMFTPYQGGVLMSHLDFIGRLYLIPVTLMLVLLAIERRTIAIAVLLIPIVWGGVQTYRDHARMQRTYRRIYRTAAESPTKPLVVDFPEKPLHDTVRGVEIGTFPDAHVRIDAKTGRLLYR
jgi:hypothetical protein